MRNASSGPNKIQSFPLGGQWRCKLMAESLDDGSEDGIDVAREGTLRPLRADPLRVLPDVGLCFRTTHEPMSGRKGNEISSCLIQGERWVASLFLRFVGLHSSLRVVIEVVKPLPPQMGPGRILMSLRLIVRQVVRMKQAAPCICTSWHQQKTSVIP